MSVTIDTYSKVTSDLSVKYYVYMKIQSSLFIIEGTILNTINPACHISP